MFLEQQVSDAWMEHEKAKINYWVVTKELGKDGDEERVRMLRAGEHLQRVEAALAQARAQ